jgi:hypothetical protein
MHDSGSFLFMKYELSIFSLAFSYLAACDMLVRMMIVIEVKCV